MAVGLFRGRKGMFFTIVAILIVTILFVSFSPEYVIRNDYQEQVVESRFKTSNDLVDTIKNSYVPAAVEASSYHALQALSSGYIRTNRAGFANRAEFEEYFVSMMLTGVTGGTLDCDASLSSPTAGSLVGLLNAIKSASKEHLQIDAEFHHVDCDDFAVEIYQNNATGAFLVGVNLTVNFTVDSGLLRWDDVENISVFFEFEGIDDPLYSANFPSGPPNVNKFLEVDVKLWDMERTRMSLVDRSYRHAGADIVDNSDEAKYHAPSFLDRFVNGYNTNNNGQFFGNDNGDQNDYSACCGIESLIRPDVMGITSDSGKSYVDWCYFSSTSSECNQRYNPNPGVSTTTTPSTPKNIKCLTSGSILARRDADSLPGSLTLSDTSWKYTGFRLDENHVETYNVTRYIEDSKKLNEVVGDSTSYLPCPV